MAGFILKKGRPTVEWFPKKASTTFTANDLVYADASGAIQPADATSGDHIGVILKTVTSGDGDFASNTYVPVWIPNSNTIFEAEVTGTLTTGMLGNPYDLADANTVDVGNTDKKVVTCVGFVSSTKGLFKVNATAYDVDVATT